MKYLANHVISANNLQNQTFYFDNEYIFEVANNIENNKYFIEIKIKDNSEPKIEKFLHVSNSNSKVQIDTVIGQSGSGKTTLLKVIAATLEDNYINFYKINNEILYAEYFLKLR